jgi:pimeloyl-ACP methyl ester carboxylesterase
VAPFLRGYHPTELPDRGFGVAELAEDVLALEAALCGSGRRSAVIGHDWGAAAVYGALGRDAGRWACAVAASVPPTDDSIDAGALTQLRRSFYSFLFQLPDIDVPVQIAAADDMALIDMLWRDWSPDLGAPDEIARAKAALRPPGHLRAAITYYRDAPTRPPKADIESGPQLGWDVPLLYLHGKCDGCIDVDAVARVHHRLRPNVRVALLEGRGHFLHLEAPDQVKDRILGFLAEHSEG